MNHPESLAKFKQDAVSIISETELYQKFRSGKILKVKMGADPSRPDLHLGHVVILRKLRILQELGHEIIFVIGDFTAMIGDPTGKSKSRPVLTFEQTRENGKSYFQQVTKILDPAKTTIVYNSEWLSRLTFEDVLRLAGQYTLARVLERDDFAKRYKENQPIGLYELLYPLMQGYDSVALHADLEVGGTDQTFNLLVGRDLQKAYDQNPQDVVTFPLLIGLDGKEKMSKSMDNYIGIGESADIMFRKCMQIPDTILPDYFRMTTDIPAEQYLPLLYENIREAHLLYAREIVSFFHNTSAAEAAENKYISIARGVTPSDIDVFCIADKQIAVIDLLKLCGYASSNSDARRLISSGIIKIEDMVIKDYSQIIDCTEGIILRKGKNHVVKIIVR